MTIWPDGDEPGFEAAVKLRLSSTREGRRSVVRHVHGDAAGGWAAEAAAKKGAIRNE